MNTNINSEKNLNKKILSIIFISICFLTSVYAVNGKTVPLWPLIIYRPSETENIDIIRCWIKIEDENGNDITYECASASYAWYDLPNVKHSYERTWFLSGGMAMHLNLKQGKYKISFYTPKEHLENFFELSDKDWISNIFEYDTENPCNVIFVSPVADDNGFYTGSWHIDYKAPAFYKYTKPFRF